MFEPKWKKEALFLAKSAQKFVDYKRDLLKPERVLEIDSRRMDLLAAIKSKDLAQVGEASKQVRSICENSLPKEQPLGWLEENVEVMFVAIVIALGLRAYYLQPFRIPTGSMQPTLNGIIGKQLVEEKWPSFPVRMVEKALRGRTYIKMVAEKDTRMPISQQTNGALITDIRDVQAWHFFSRSNLMLADGTSLRMPAPGTPMYDAGLRAALQKAAQNGGVLPKGSTFCEGYIDTGDLVLVDKVSYHFRKPVRGEVFVFNTIDIPGIQKRSGPQGAGSHYIKRLCGVPGDTLSVQPPNLLVDGKIAKEAGMQRVMKSEGLFQKSPAGYELAKGEGGSLPQSIAKTTDTLTLSAKARPGLNEYAALGDNTANSLDSRYWGSVKEFNLVGPALFSLWPFTTGHWGFIR